jgi:hypothetical protein
MTRILPFLAIITAVAAQDLQLPNKSDSVRFAVLGDTGTGESHQYETAKQVERLRDVFPFDFVIMLGDNLYGGDKPKDFDKKFERPYQLMLSRGVKFYATLGNHDDPNQRFYKHFNMDGKRYYSFKPKDGVRFFSLDSNYMDKQQIDWIEKELAGSGSDWKIAFFHHPLYSSGEKHGPDQDLRRVLEPMFLKHGVSVVFAGHEHFYERLNPQNGIYYFIEGGSAKLRKGNIRRTAQSAFGFDSDNTFMLCEIERDKLHFQTITRAGKTIDRGVIARAGEGIRSRSIAQPATGGR